MRVPAAYAVSAASLSPVAGAAVAITAVLSDSSGTSIPDAGRTVTWSATGTGGSFAAPTSTTDATGTATVMFTTGPTVGSYVVTGTDNGSLKGSSPSITSVAGPAAAAKSVLTAVPTTLPADGTSKATITLQAEDANGNFAHASAGTAAIAATTGTISATTDNANGTYTATLTAPVSAGSSIVSAALGGAAVTSKDTVAFNAVGPAPTHYTVVATTTTPVTGAAVTITAQLADASNASVALAGQTVTWSAAGETGGSFTPPTSVTTAGGTATTTYTTGTSVGTAYTIGATDGGALTGNVSVSNTAGTPASLTWTRASHIVITDTAYSAAAFTGVNEFGRTVSPAVTYSSRTVAAGTVNSAGLVAPVSRGQTMVVATASANSAAKDSVLMAVATAGSPVVHTDLTGFDIANGTTFTLTVIADMRSSTLLGSATVSVTWDPTQLTYVSDADGSSGVGATVNNTNAANGTLVVSAANSTGFGGSVQLRTITFTAASTVGKTASLKLLVSDLSAAGTFASLLATTLSVTTPLVLR
ncbi:MAG TPA: Ig-like domain-containing protein [Gemmatimonadaceae bacterium]